MNAPSLLWAVLLSLLVLDVSSEVCPSNAQLTAPGSLYFPRYDNRMSCTWRVHGPRSGAFVIALDWLHTQECCDYLEVYSGTSRNISNLLVRWQGSLGPRAVFVPSTEALLYFRSDYYTVDYGFSLTYTSMNTSVGISSGEIVRFTTAAGGLENGRVLNIMTPVTGLLFLWARTEVSRFQIYLKESSVLGEWVYLPLKGKFIQSSSQIGISGEDSTAFTVGLAPVITLGLNATYGSLRNEHSTVAYLISPSSFNQTWLTHLEITVTRLRLASTAVLGVAFGPIYALANLQFCEITALSTSGECSYSFPITGGEGNDLLMLYSKSGSSSQGYFADFLVRARPTYQPTTVDVGSPVPNLNVYSPSLIKYNPPTNCVTTTIYLLLLDLPASSALYYWIGSADTPRSETQRLGRLYGSFTSIVFGSCSPLYIYFIPGRPNSRASYQILAKKMTILLPVVPNLVTLNAGETGGYYLDIDPEAPYVSLNITLNCRSNPLASFSINRLGIDGASYGTNTIVSSQPTAYRTYNPLFFTLRYSALSSLTFDISAVHVVQPVVTMPFGTVLQTATFRSNVYIKILPSTDLRYYSSIGAYRGVVNLAVIRGTVSYSARIGGARGFNDVPGQSYTGSTYTFLLDSPSAAPIFLFLSPFYRFQSVDDCVVRVTSSAAVWLPINARTSVSYNGQPENTYLMIGASPSVVASRYRRILRVTLGPGIQSAWVTHINQYSSTFLSSVSNGVLYARLWTDTTFSVVLYPGVNQTAPGTCLVSLFDEENLPFEWVPGTTVTVPPRQSLFNPLVVRISSDPALLPSHIRVAHAAGAPGGACGTTIFYKIGSIPTPTDNDGTFFLTYFSQFVLDSLYPGEQIYFVVQESSCSYTHFTLSAPVDLQETTTLYSISPVQHVTASYHCTGSPSALFGIKSITFQIKGLVLNRREYQLTYYQLPAGDFGGLTHSSDNQTLVVRTPIMGATYTVELRNTYADVTMKISVEIILEPIRPDRIEPGSALTLDTARGCLLQTTIADRRLMKLAVSPGSAHSTISVNVVAIRDSALVPLPNSCSGSADWVGSGSLFFPATFYCVVPSAGEYVWNVTFTTWGGTVHYFLEVFPSPALGLPTVATVPGRTTSTALNTVTYVWESPELASSEEMKIEMAYNYVAPNATSPLRPGIAFFDLTSSPSNLQSQRMRAAIRKYFPDIEIANKTSLRDLFLANYTHVVVPKINTYLNPNGAERDAASTFMQRGGVFISAGSYTNLYLMNGLFGALGDIGYGYQNSTRTPDSLLFGWTSAPQKLHTPPTMTCLSFRSLRVPNIALYSINRFAASVVVFPISAGKVMYYAGDWDTPETEWDYVLYLGLRSASFSGLPNDFGFLVSHLNTLNASGTPTPVGISSAVSENGSAVPGEHFQAISIVLPPDGVFIVTVVSYLTSSVNYTLRAYVPYLSIPRTTAVVDATPPAAESQMEDNTKMIIGGSAAVAVIALIAVVVGALMYRRRHRANRLDSDATEMENIKTGGKKVSAGYSELEEA